MNTNKMISLTGFRSGKVLVIRETSERNENNKLLCECICDCGKIFLTPRYRLLTGGNKIYSCGCSDRRKTLNGLYKHRLRKIYLDIKNRCYYKQDIGYNNYGGRGITMCDEWLNSFDSFYNWSIENGYEESLTIDRINNEDGYNPNNCRWVDSIEQNNNRRNNHLVTYNNETHTIAEWCILKNIKHSCLLERLKRGWSVEDALNKPVQKHKKQH